ncbi:hypothetical protein [Bradyrhizobium sp. ARR65]|uniref:hypothetical protein n=1 Tax=Bradyrhizobium sp. ARR65 TaxID=1040989 RepID=UPI000A905AF5|nr:hypothetical protein [Bradyrhizobium sp. ARR65]
MIVTSGGEQKLNGEPSWNGRWSAGLDDRAHNSAIPIEEGLRIHCTFVMLVRIGLLTAPGAKFEPGLHINAALANWSVRFAASWFDVAFIKIFLLAH